MSDEEIKRLVALKREDFEEREWPAIAWLRHYLLFEGEVPDRELDRVFQAAYSSPEKRRIFAVFKVMLFFNMLSNNFVAGHSRLLREYGSEPALPGFVPPEQKPPRKQRKKP